MKRLYYILIALMVVACNEGHKLESLKNTDMFEVEETVAAMENMEGAEAAIDFEMLATQKLQDYVDLLILQKQHPEFRNELKSQLLQLSIDTLVVFSKLAVIEAGTEITISDLEQLGAVERVSDSVQKITFSFNINSEATVQRDTLQAIFTTKSVTVDGLQLTATKVLFISSL